MRRRESEGTWQINKDLSASFAFQIKEGEKKEKSGEKDQGKQRHKGPEYTHNKKQSEKKMDV